MNILQSNGHTPIPYCLTELSAYYLLQGMINRGKEINDPTPLFRLDVETRRECWNELIHEAQTLYVWYGINNPMNSDYESEFEPLIELYNQGI